MKTLLLVRKPMKKLSIKENERIIIKNDKLNADNYRMIEEADFRSLKAFVLNGSCNNCGGKPIFTISISPKYKEIIYSQNFIGTIILSNGTIV